MNSVFYQILFSLLVAHLLADFIFQTNNDVKNKNKLFVFLKHIITVTLLSYVLCGYWNDVNIPLYILISHTVIDSIKRMIKVDSLGVFVFDQAAHLSVLFFISYYLPPTLLAKGLSNSFWIEAIGIIYLKVVLIIVSLILVTKFSSIIIAYIIKPYQIKLGADQENNSLNIRTGRLVGILERLIILILFLADMGTIVGFLITAKSILRYGEIKNEEDKAKVEYILIGTLLSFALGIIIAYAAKIVLPSL